MNDITEADRASREDSVVHTLRILGIPEDAISRAVEREDPEAAIWARSLDHSIPIDLYYCTPGAEQAHFLDVLYEIADRYPRFRVIPIRKSSLGRLSVEDIAAVNPNVLNGHVFVCGPQVMIDNMRTGFAARGMPPDRIHSESFDFR